VKTSKAVLVTGLMAGLSALPLTASAAQAAAAPTGSASAAALQVSLSLQPLKNVVNTVGGAAGLSWSTVTSALQTLQDALCPVTCSLGLQIPTDLPNNLTVQVAQANAKGTLDVLANDIVAGHSDSTPVATNWDVLNVNIDALQKLLTSFIDQGTAALASGNITQLQSFLSGLSASSLKLSLPALGDASFNVLGTVQANLPGKSAQDHYATANAVSITNIGKSVLPPSSQGWITVDPFHACAASAESAADCKASGAQVSADNSLVDVHLPDLVGGSLDLTALKANASTLQSLIDALSKAIADPSNAGSILSGAASSLPAPLQGPVGTLGGLLGGVTGTVTGSTAGTPISLDALKLWDAKLAATLDALNNVINALTNLNLPDVSNLIASKEDIATAKTVPLVGGGVAATATSTLGSLSILPIGDSLATVLNQVIGTAGLPLSQVTANTALLSIDGITSSAQAQIGGAAPCGAGRYVCGSSGLRTVSVLGQSIDLDKATSGLALGPGQEWKHVVTVPTLGSVTLDVTRGVEQIVADTSSYREVHMAALEVRLINGDFGCNGASNCSDPLALGSIAGTNATRTANTGNSSGIALLGDTGSTILDVAAPIATAAVSLDTPTTSCAVNCSTPNQVALVKTGLFGGSALPAGFLLIGVAISLRVLPNLRLKLRRVR